MYSKKAKICIFLLVALCGLQSAAFKNSSELSNEHTWMKEYKTGLYSDATDKGTKRGLYRSQFVEMQGRMGRQTLLPTHRPPIPGQGFVLKTVIMGEVESIKAFILNEQGKPILSLVNLPHNKYYFNDHLFTGTFPDQPFFIAFSIQFKNKPANEQIINPRKIVPQTDIDSFLFTFAPDTTSVYFNKFPQGTPHSEKVKKFSYYGCLYGQRLASALYKGAEGYIEPTLYSESNTNSHPVPIPFFYIRHSLGRGVEQDQQCYLEVLKKKNQLDEMDFIAQEEHWTMKECKGHQNHLLKFGNRSQYGKMYAFQQASCVIKNRRVYLRLRIGFSKNPDFQFTDKPVIIRKPKVVNTAQNKVRPNQFKPLSLRKTKKRKDRGLYRVQFVERQGRLGHQGMFASRRPPVPGRGFLLEATIFGEVDHADALLLDRHKKKISKLKMLPRNEYSHNDYYFTGTFPDQPFFIAASVKFKNEPDVELIISPEIIEPSTDVDSFLFTFQPDVTTKEFKKALPGKSQAEKIALFSEGNCEYGQMVAYALHEGAEGYTPPSGSVDPKDKDEALPIPFFYIRHSLGLGVEPKGQCYLEVLQIKNRFEGTEFITQDKHWTMKACHRYQDLLRKFGKRTQVGGTYAFQEASCISSDQGINLRLRIGFSKKPDFQFADKPVVARKPEPPAIHTSGKQVHLKKLCEIQEGILSGNNTPLNLSFEQSGKALIRILKTNKSAVFQAPDCTIVSRYKEADLANHTISLDGKGLFAKNRNYGSRYAPKKKNETFGIEKSDGTIAIISPPEYFDRRKAEYPKISVDGSALIWRLYRKPYGSSYLIQDLNGGTLHELIFPLGQLQKAPEIYMLDMKQKTFLAYLRNKGVAEFNFKGERKGDFIDIPGVGLYFSHSPRFKLFRDKNNQMNWVGWNNADMIMERDNTFVTWKTDFGKGQHDFKPGQSINSVAISGDGRYIAVAYRTRRDTMSGKQDYMFVIISTESGQQVYSKKLGNSRSSGHLIHEVAFLKSKYLAVNRLAKDSNYAFSEAVELFEIQE